MTDTRQATWDDMETRVRRVFAHAEKQTDDPDHVVIAISGGTDSITAGQLAVEYGPEYGLTPTRVLHANTGLAIPQSRLVARTFAAIHDLEYSEQGYRNSQDSIAARILTHGWPGAYGGTPWSGGHALEFVNRKEKPMQQEYVDLDGQQVWISGARATESKKRSANVPETGVESKKPRRTWVSPIAHVHGEEKRDYIREHGLPVSEAYLMLGISGECVACAYDDVGILDDIDILCPELAYAIRSVATWLYQRVKRGDVDLAPKRLCWGWEPGEERHIQPTERGDTQAVVGCSDGSCATRTSAGWILELPSEQLIDRRDVERYWSGGDLPAGRFEHLHP